MLELLLNFVFIVLAAVALYILYFQTRVYQEQKELIDRESEALNTLKLNNFEKLRSRLRIRKVVQKG